MDPYCIL
jgi:Ca2+-dependent lipid-binding protein